MAGAQKSRVVVNPLSRNSACENCRMRKIRCSGDRNGCEACKKSANSHNIDVSQICVFPPERLPNNRKRSNNGEDKSDQTLRTPSISRQRRGSSAETYNSDNSTPASSVGSAKDFEHLLAFSSSSSSPSNYPTANSSPYLGYSNYNLPSPQNSPYPISLFDPSGQRQPVDIDQSPNYLYSEIEQQALAYLNQQNSYGGGNGYQTQINTSSEEYRQLVHTLLAQQSRQQQSYGGNRFN